jgi:citrate lyase beta subunit
LFKADTCAKLGRVATEALSKYAPDAAALGRILDLPERLAPEIHTRILRKLQEEPVEDYRIDFEDGFGYRSDKEEDDVAVRSAMETAKAMETGTLPPFFGIRIKSLTTETEDRALRTLDLYMKTLLSSSGGKTPLNFVVTLPKITIPEQVRALVRLLDDYGGISMEMMIETPQALRAIPDLLVEADQSCSGLHFGPYDYMSSLGITGPSQHLLHPACQHARMTMLVAAAGLDLGLSDGPTNILPIAVHKAPQTEAERNENSHAIEDTWRLHYRHVRSALDCGFYQGWDLHPAQLPVRFAAVYSFFREGLSASSLRLRNFMAQAAQATTLGSVFDDAATGQGLVNHFLRGFYAGAISEDDIPSLTGLTVDQLRLGSFARIMDQLREEPGQT